MRYYNMQNKLAILNTLFLIALTITVLLTHAVNKTTNRRVEEIGATIDQWEVIMECDKQCDI